MLQQSSLTWLQQLFDTNIDSAFNSAESFICGNSYCSIQDFRLDMSKRHKCHVCHESWNKPTLAVHCSTCGKGEWSCICLDCFNNGNHEGHNYRFHISHKGNCDCGDELSWKETGFCKKHHQKEKKVINKLNPELEKNLIMVFTAALHNCSIISIYEPFDFIKILQWLTDFSNLSDDVRRCLTITVTQKINLKELILNTPQMSTKAAIELSNFFGSLINDDVFRESFGVITFEVYPKIVWMLLKISLNNRIDKRMVPLAPLRAIADFFFQGFTTATSEFIEKHEIDWASMIIEILTLIVNFSKMGWNYQIYDKCDFDAVYNNISILLQYFKKKEDQKERIKWLTIKIAKLCLKIEAALPTKREVNRKVDDPSESHLLLHRISYIFSTIMMMLLRAQGYIEEIPNILFEFIQKQIIEDQFDLSKENHILSRSILSPGVVSSSCSVLHSCFGFLLIRSKERIPEIFKNLSLHNNISINEFSLFTSLLPIRQMGVLSLIRFQMFVRNPNTYESAVSSMNYCYNIKSRFVPLFSLIQICFGMCTCKDEFIEMIANVFGIFQDIDDESSYVTKLCFFIFITELIFDRVCISFDIPKLIRQEIISQLKIRPIPAPQISRTLWGRLESNEEFLASLNTYAERISTENGTSYKLKNDEGWHPFLPWQNMPTIISLITSEMQKPNKKLISFPELPPNIYGLDLQSGISSKFLIALEYKVLSDAVYLQGGVPCVMIHIVLNLLIAWSKVSPMDQTELNDTICIEVANEIELAAKIPETFHQFIYAMIQLGDKPAVNAYQLISELQGAGSAALVAMGLVCPHQKSREDAKVLKEAAKLRKERILRDFAERQKYYDFSIEPTSSNLCSICQVGEGILAYPMYVYDSAVPFFAQSSVHGNTPQVVTSVRQFKLCPHPIHAVCVDRPEHFQCPIDRCYRNCLLPLLDGFDKLRSDDLYSAVFGFAFRAFKGPDETLMVQSIAAHISVSEIRYRLVPGFIDSLSFKVLTRNLFLGVWHFFRIPEYSDRLERLRQFEDPTEELISLLLKSDNPPLHFAPIVDTIMHKVNPREMLEFARRAALVEKFCLNAEFENKNGFFDWDFLLSAESLSERYGRKINDTDLPSYTLHPLAKQFTRLAAPPFSLPMTDYSSETVFTLMSGKVAKTLSSGPRDIPLLREVIESNAASTFEPYLALTGQRVSAVYIASNVIGRSFKLTDIYVDRYGDSDIGFQRGLPLSLSNERLIRLIDSIIGGDWIDDNSGAFSVFLK